MRKLLAAVLLLTAAANTGGWQTWTSRTAAASRLYLVATGGTGGDLANVNWFQFAR